MIAKFKHCFLIHAQAKIQNDTISIGFKKNRLKVRCITRETTQNFNDP